MRSSKSRSRNKPNRNRPNTVGNVVNRVFDSSGPEGKVRGTPQQIIEKYNQLARDAQLSNDRVATENFQQHAEHYLRLLGEAQKEIDAKREQQERENRDRQAERDRDRPQGDSDQANAPQPDGEPVRERDMEISADSSRDGSAPRATEEDHHAIREAESDTVAGGDNDDDQSSTLVETPESKPKRAPRKPRRAAPQSEAPTPAPDNMTEVDQQEDADAPKTPKARAPRARKPKGDTVHKDDTSSVGGASSDTAAE